MRFGETLGMLSALVATAACGAARPVPPPATTLAYAVAAPPAERTAADAPPPAKSEPAKSTASDTPEEDAQVIADGVPEANLSVAAVASGLFAVTEVSCRADEGIGALPKTAALASAFAHRKKILDRCAKGHPHETRVRWTSVSGRITEAVVIYGADPANRCIERALLGAREPIAGTCAATVRIGVAKHP